MDWRWLSGNNATVPTNLYTLRSFKFAHQVIRAVHEFAHFKFAHPLIFVNFSPFLAFFGQILFFSAHF